jgi:putative phosphoribosyl transferase
MRFKNRIAAGELLASKLKEFRRSPQTIVVALPRGGVVVAAVIAKELGLPLDIVVPRKIAAPSYPEYALGAIDETGEAVWGAEGAVHGSWIKSVFESEQMEIERRLNLYRGGRAARDFKEKTLILVDDGLATGLTMRAAIRSARKLGGRKIIVAVPHAAADSLDLVRREVDQLVCLYEILDYGAVGAYYDEFPQIEDHEVVRLMKQTYD